MKLPRPAEIHLDEVTRTMLTDLADLARQVNEIRPLSLPVLRQVRDEMFAERVFSSNAIEGNTLTIRETRLILQTKTYLDVRQKREAMEALNLGAAATQIEQFLEIADAWHDMDRFRTIHEVLMKGVNDHIAGVIRNCDVDDRRASDSPQTDKRCGIQPSRSFPFSGTMPRSTVWYWQDSGPLGHSRVHPFMDGNGRMARLWQDLLLLRSRLTVAMIRPQDRQAYLENLAKADEGTSIPSPNSFASES